MAVRSGSDLKSEPGSESKGEGSVDSNIPDNIAQPTIEHLSRPMHALFIDESLPINNKLEEVNLESTNVTMAGISGSSMTSEMWSENEDQHGIDDIQGKTKIYTSFLDIVLCLIKVESGPEFFPLYCTSFERGVIASISTNNFLMTKGLISPAIYI